MASAATALGVDLDSSGWRVIGAAGTAAVVLLWLYVAARTAVEGVKGSIL
jgi:hypothetical protein